MYWQSLWNLLPGWLLGLLTGLLTIGIADLWRSSRRRKMFKTAIRSELDFSLENLVYVAWDLEVHYGDFDDHTVEWLCPLMMKYGVERAQQTSVSAFPTEPGAWDKAKQYMDSFVNEPDERKQVISHIREEYEKARTSPSLRKLNLTVLASGSEAVRIMDTALQKKLLGIMRHLAYYNELVDESRFFLRATLSSDLSDRNRQIVEENLDGAYKTILREVKILLSRMDELIRDESLW